MSFMDGLRKATAPVVAGEVEVKPTIKEMKEGQLSTGKTDATFVGAGMINDEEKECSEKTAIHEKVQMPESRHTALTTAINQLRNARKNIMIAKVDEDLEEELLMDIMIIGKKLKNITDNVEVVKARKRKKADDGDPRTEAEINEENAMKELEG